LTVVATGRNGKLMVSELCSGHSIQARGIEPDVVVEQDIPDDLNDKGGAVRGEAKLTETTRCSALRPCS
jgi:C-terminal processing protease CtpA/Prc